MMVKFKKKGPMFYKKMIAEYDIKVMQGKQFYEATTKFLPDVTDFGVTKQEAIELLCSSIETTEAHFNTKLQQLKRG